MASFDPLEILTPHLGLPQTLPQAFPDGHLIALSSFLNIYSCLLVISLNNSPYSTLGFTKLCYTYLITSWVISALLSQVLSNYF